MTIIMFELPRPLDHHLYVFYKLLRRVVWIDVEGIPLQAWSHSNFNKIACKWGELVYMDDYNSSNKYSIRLCVKTRVQQLIAKSFKVVLRGKILVVHAKEIIGWVLEFIQEDEEQSEEQSKAGIGRKEKKDWVKSLCHTNGVNFLSIQETKIVSFDIFVMKSIWGNMLFDFATCSAQGRSGGLINRWHGEVVITRDFNEVRFSSKRYGTIFHASHVDNLNSFITDSYLIDVPLGGYSFTWSNKHASKMSKLDRFLISEGLFELFPNLSDAWNNAVVHDLNAMVFLKNKLKILKHKLKAWGCQKRSNREFDRKELHDKLIDIDSRHDKGKGLHDDVYNRADIFCKIGKIDLKTLPICLKKPRLNGLLRGMKIPNSFMGCLLSFKASVLVNGSPTDEFSFHKGLRQGDPLSPSLFILVMESLHVSFQRVIDIGVNSSEISLMAGRLGCMANKLPFTYLGVKVRANMAHISSWNIVVQRVKPKLSSWKAKTLSVGEVIKSVLGALPTYYMSLFRVSDGVLNKLKGLRNSFFLGADIGDRKMMWVCWKKVMAQKQYGGLGVSSLFALNRALLFKWIWRFYASQSGLWLDVIKAIHGSNCALDQPLPNRLGCLVWNMVRKAIGNLKSKNVDLMEFCKKVIRNSYNTSFWHEKWLGYETADHETKLAKQKNQEKKECLCSTTYLLTGKDRPP
nr:RNA-directed DNA polymerase, eukaryota [Tanacetum cinerariifolium]